MIKGNSCVPCQIGGIAERITTIKGITMAYLHKDTFEILHDSNIDGYLDDYFEVDEFMALPIQTLNRKGYRTLYCCQGHPFDDINELFSTVDYSKKHCPFPNIIEMTKADNPEYPDCKYRLVQRVLDDRRSYIVFDKGVSLPSLPEDFAIEQPDDSITYRDENGEVVDMPLAGHVVIETFYDMDMPLYDYLKDTLQAMSDLNDWALSLPPLNA